MWLFNLFIVTIKCHIYVLKYFLKEGGVGKCRKIMLAIVSVAAVVN